jgi:hypothetical protein
MKELLKVPWFYLCWRRHGPSDFPEWTMEAVEGSVLEALDLAKIRAVDPDALGSLGHYLPTLFFAFNTGAPLHFTPTGSSWLNQIERWFAEITRKRRMNKFKL